MNTVTAQAICYTIASKKLYLNLIRGYIVLIMRHLRLSSLSFLFLLWRMSLISQIASALWPFSDPFHILSTHRMKSSLRFEDGKGLRWRKSQKGHFVEKNCSLKKKEKEKKMNRKSLPTRQWHSWCCLQKCFSHFYLFKIFQYLENNINKRTQLSSK